MAVDYLDIDRLTVDPTKADVVLVVDAAHWEGGWAA
jgi:hypothetical protein